MIQLTGASKRFGPKILFEELDWLVTPGERTGLVGANGTGKSTLLKILAGIDSLDGGSQTLMKGVTVGSVSDVRLRYVPQTASLETPVTIGIDPSKLQLPMDRAALNDAIAKLVNKGMRATLASSLVLPGASGVSLDMVGRPGSAHLVMSEPPWTDAPYDEARGRVIRSFAKNDGRPVPPDT